MFHRHSLVLTALAVVLTAAGGDRLLAQDTERTIDPGMTREQVIERLGAPLSERRTGNATFLFYANGCERTCGMNDLVVLDDGRVVDAIFRAAGRRYSGVSSSPAGVVPARTAPGTAEDPAGAVRRAGRGGIVIASPSDAEAAAARTPAATVTGVEVSTPETQPAAATPRPPQTTAGAPLGGNAPQITPQGGNAPNVTPRGGNAPHPSSLGGGASPAQSGGGGAAAAGQRPILPVPLPGAKVNPADSVRALTPDRPTALPGAKLNPADSARAEAIRRQLADTTRKPD